MALEATVQQPSIITDAAALAAAALFMFKRFTFASGELEMPCDPALIDEHIQLIEGVLRSLEQKPPASVLASWRHLIATKLTEGAAACPAARLVLQYEPFDPLVGLTGGFQLRITLKDASSPSIRSSNPSATLNARAQLEQLTLARGEIKMPCVPSMLERHLQQIEAVLRSLRQILTDEELQAWRQTIAPKLAQWFQASSNTYLTIQYEIADPRAGLHGGVKLSVIQTAISLENHYRNWAETREGPLFGSHADAKVMAVAVQLGEPATVRILDIGAGTGRNSLALARQGYAVEALELTQVLAEQLSAAANAEALPITLLQGNILDPTLKLRADYYHFVFLSEVIASHFRSPEQVRYVLTRLCETIAPGGLLLFNLFLAVDDYEPDTSIRELSQFYWCYVMTRSELQAALKDLPLEVLADESVFDYEREHLPAEAFPPTSWFTNWSTGRNLFPIAEAPPIELRWILCRLM